MKPKCLLILLVSYFISFTLQHAYTVSNAAWNDVRSYYSGKGVSQSHIDQWRPYCIDSTVPSRPLTGNEALIALGYVDVTASPFNAAGNGSADDTQAIQDAIDYASLYSLAVFFPAGDYKISDTLDCQQLVTIRSNGQIDKKNNPPVVLVGSTANPNQRARLVLKNNANGFGSSTNPRVIVRFWAPRSIAHLPLSNGNYNSANHPEQEQVTDSFDLYFGSIDIVVGSGNPGAIGLRMQGAEGCKVQDVHVDLSASGYAGFLGLPASGGSTAKVQVTGGDHGIILREWIPSKTDSGSGTVGSGSGSQPSPTIANVTLINQSAWAIDAEARSMLTLVGADIQTNKKGPVIKVRKLDVFEGQVSLIDSTVKYATTNANNDVFDTQKSFYVVNSYLKNADSIDGLSVNSAGWVYVEEAAKSYNPTNKTHLPDSQETVWVDQVDQGSSSLLVSENGQSPPADLQSRHDWGDDFPSFESSNIAIVTDSVYGAKGDGIANDTAAIQAAIDAKQIVFLPKGRYNIKDTLYLKSNTKLIGVHHRLSEILGIENQSNGRFGGSNSNPANNGRPMIETVNSASASPILAFVGVRPSSLWGNHDPTVMSVYGLKWQSGAGSMIRNVDITPLKLYNWNVWNAWKKLGYTSAQVSAAQSNILTKTHAYDAFPDEPGPAVIQHSPVQIVNNGGGRWWSFWCHGYFPYDNDVPILKVDGTDQPLRIYHLHAQHSHADALIEINNASHVDVYGTKTECHIRFMDIKGSDHIRIYGGGGAFGPGYDINGVNQPMFYFKNCEDFLLATFAQQVHYSNGDSIRIDAARFPLVKLQVMTYPGIRVDDGGSRFDLPSNHRPILYKEGNPHLTEVVVEPEGDLLSLAVTHDAYIRNGSNSAVNYGGVDELILRNQATYGRESLIQFNINALTSPVTAAYLKLNVTSSNPDANAVTSLYVSSKDNWNESTVSWNTGVQNSIGSAIQSWDGLQANEELLIDITAAVNAEIAGADGKLSLNLKLSNSSFIEYASSDHASTALHPALLYESGSGSGNGVDVVLDDGDPGFSLQGWYISSNQTSGCENNDAMTVSNGSSNRATYAPGLSSGSYEVFVKYTDSNWSGLGTDCPYIVNHSGGATTVLVDQTVNGGSWVSIGTYNMNSSSTVQITANLSNGKKPCVDAVRFVGQ